MIGPAGLLISNVALLLLLLLYVSLSYRQLNVYDWCRTYQDNDSIDGTQSMVLPSVHVRSCQRYRTSARQTSTRKY